MECCLPPGAPALISRRPHRRCDKASVARSAPTIIQHTIRVSATISSRRKPEQTGVSLSPRKCRSSRRKTRTKSGCTCQRRRSGALKVSHYSSVGVAAGEGGGAGGEERGEWGWWAAVRNGDKFKFKRGGEKRCGHDGRCWWSPVMTAILKNVAVSPIPSVSAISNPISIRHLPWRVKWIWRTTGTCPVHICFDGLCQEPHECYIPK